MHGLRCKCLIVFLLALATPAFCLEWYQVYDKGQAAIKKGDCKAGKAFMQEALQKNPKADLKSRPYGTFVLEYIPQFFLFQCAVSEGDFAAAQDYLKQAEAAGVYASSKAAEFRALKLKLPQQTVKPITPTVVPPTNTNPPANTTPTTTTPPAQQNPEVNKQAEAQKALNEARNAFASGDYERARMAAYRADALSPNLPEVRKLRQDIERAERARQGEQDKARKLDQATSALKSGDLITAASLAAELRVKYPGDRQVQALSDEIQKMRDSQKTTDTAGDQQKTLERQVVVSFYKGQYNAVIELAQQGLQNNPDNWHLHFFLGCSYASLAMMEKDNQENLRLAHASFTKAKRIDSSASTPPYISPKILKIYNNS